jgi:hypothetical protein
MLPVGAENDVTAARGVAPGVRFPGAPDQGMAVLMWARPAGVTAASR